MLSQTEQVWSVVLFGLQNTLLCCYWKSYLEPGVVANVCCPSPFCSDFLPVIS